MSILTLETGLNYELFQPWVTIRLDGIEITKLCIFDPDILTIYGQEIIDEYVEITKQTLYSLGLTEAQSLEVIKVLSSSLQS
jgi:hypothetical protein